MSEPREATKSAREQLIGSLALIAVGVGAMAYYHYGFYHPQVLESSRVTVAHKSDSHQTVTRPSRRIALGGRSFWQVELEPGYWTDCGSSCEAAVRQATFKD